MRCNEAIVLRSLDTITSVYTAKREKIQTTKPRPSPGEHQQSAIDHERVHMHETGAGGDELLWGIRSDRTPKAKNTRPEREPAMICVHTHIRGRSHN